MKQIFVLFVFNVRNRYAQYSYCLFAFLLRCFAMFGKTRIQLDA